MSSGVTVRTNVISVFTKKKNFKLEIRHCCDKLKKIKQKDEYITTWTDGIEFLQVDVEEQFKNFFLRNYNLEDKPRTGRPVEPN